MAAQLPALPETMVACACDSRPIDRASVNVVRFIASPFMPSIHRGRGTRAGLGSTASARSCHPIARMEQVREARVSVATSSLMPSASAQPNDRDSAPGVGRHADARRPSGSESVPEDARSPRSLARWQAGRDTMSQDHTALRRAAGRGLTAVVLSLLIFASGAAAVALEVLWIRDFALWFGSTAAAAAVVLSVYFAGLALGARLGGRLGRRDPLRTYALLEAGVALSVVCYVAARPWLPPAAAWLAHVTAAPALALARTLLATLVLLVPTILLGATLPVVAAAVRNAAGAARLYACNTIGGAAGALATGFVVLPTLGARAAFLTAATVDLAVAL